MNEPFVKVHHRHGYVFIRIVKPTKVGNMTTMIRLNAKDASSLGHEIIEAASAVTTKLILRERDE